MIRQSKGKIFLADERGLDQAPGFRSLPMFNFGTYFNEHKSPAGDIYIFNDDMLDTGASLQMTAPDHSYVIILPVMGAVVCRHSSRREQLIAAGQVHFWVARRGESVEFTNPFQEGLISFLQIWIRADSLAIVPPSVSSYDVNDSPNTLINILPSETGEVSLPFFLSVGRFAGRKEAIYSLKQKSSSLFLFVIDGAFEVEGRLLHPGDGLVLWEIKQAEIEALSSNAILLAIETGSV